MNNNQNNNTITKLFAERENERLKKKENKRRIETNEKKKMQTFIRYKYTFYFLLDLNSIKKEIRNKNRAVNNHYYNLNELFFFLSFNFISS